MRNVFKIVNSLGSAALLLSGAAMAAPPVAFNNWSVNSAGDISGAGTGCVTQVVGVGFLQCQLLHTDGKTYIQTIIAEGFSATGTTLDRLSFRSQDFVQIGAGSSQGLASSMSIKDTATNPGTTFGTTANILTGWGTAPGTNKSEAELTLSLNTPGVAGANELFASNFNVTAITTAGNANVISVLGIGQTVGLGGTGTDKQRFELRNEPADPAISGYTIGGIANNPLGGTLNAAVGAPLQGLWVAQSIAGTGDFNVQSLSNLNGGANSFTSMTSLTSTGPVDWGTGGVFTSQFVGGTVSFN